MSRCADLRQQAARCLRVAAVVNDGTMAAALVAIADDFSAQADQVDPALEPTSLASSHRATSGGRLSGGGAADDTV
jgi:hypothetical protein